MDKILPLKLYLLFELFSTLITLFFPYLEKNQEYLIPKSLINSWDFMGTIIQSKGGGDKMKEMIIDIWKSQPEPTFLSISWK